MAAAMASYDLTKNASLRFNQSADFSTLVPESFLSELPEPPHCATGAKREQRGHSSAIT